MPKRSSQNTDAQPNSDLLTEREVRARIRVSRATLDRWVKEGAFPKFVKLHEGGSKRWLAGEVDAWLADRLAERAPEAA